MVYCLSRSQPPFSSRRRKMTDGPDRPVVIEKNRWAERESTPHSQRRLIYSQRSSPHCSICPRWASILEHGTLAFRPFHERGAMPGLVLSVVIVCRRRADRTGPPLACGLGRAFPLDRALLR